jgi:tetratricopeptide (TPR) repeat protein
MMNKNKLLSDANAYFVARQYDKALFLYAQLMKEFPEDEEIGLYAVLCDIASESEEKAQNLFDYYSVAKVEDPQNAIEYIVGMIDAYDGDIEQMAKILNDISTTATQDINAIEYEDFLKLIESRGSFRVAFEDIMFSTKVAIYNKEDFCDFVEQLIDNNFTTTALSYLETYNNHFAFDNQIENLYKKLEVTK